MNIPSNNVSSLEKHSIQLNLTSVPNEINQINPDSLSSGENCESSLEERELCGFSVIFYAAWL